MRIRLPQRQLYRLTAITAAPAVFLLIAWICTAATKDMNACRLAQVVGMKYGYPLYPDPAHGVMSSWTFGPVPALLFWVSSSFARPTTQLLVAISINACIVLMAALWSSLKFAGKQHRLFGWLAFLVFLWSVLTHESLAQVAAAVSPDGPMLALATCAVAALLEPRNKSQLVLTAVAMVLSIWCDASAFPLVIVPILYLAFDREHRTIGWYAVVFSIAAAVVSAIFLALFGAGNLWHFMVVLPMNQPWSGAELLDAVVALLHDTIPTLALIVAALALGRFLSSSNRPRSTEQAWLMFPAMALLSTPAAVLGYLKMGRHPEAFGAVHYFILMTAVTALIRVYRQCSENSAKSVVIACMCVFSTWQAMAVLLTWHRPMNLYHAIRNVYSNPQETAYAFARAHPGEVFFPWNTLSTLQAEGKLYHSEVGFNLYYRANPNEPVDVNRIRQFIPDHMHFVAFPEKHESERIRLLFPQAKQPASITQLPGFVAYTQTVQP